MDNIQPSQPVPKRIGEYLVVSPGTLQSAVKRQGQILKNQKQNRFLGEILLEMEAIDQEQLTTALRKQRMARLAQCPVFKTLSSTELVGISNKFKEVTIPPEEQFIYQGDDDPTMYVIASGKVEVYYMDIDGNKTHIAWLGPGDPIGEMAYFSGGLRTASARTAETTHLLQATYSDLTHYFENVPHVAHAFMLLIEERRKQLEELK
ncbi:MAG: cyclic nucleotide-binding domain-containing protein [Gammaproteobacteria bacterium]|nr:cyclic nucleotide-binding domain-containing protein [Gammaproteobacteria bacterium]